MSITLRPYQQQMEDQIIHNWSLPRVDGQNGASNTIAVAPTGGGKTAIMSSVTKKIQDPSVSIAHRQELVSQISVALARNGIVHRIVAAEPVIRFCITRHIEELGQTFHHPNSPVATAGVQTIIRRGDSLKQWLSTVKMWNIDEAHHVCPNNSWGSAIEMLPNAKGVGFTASPLRADRQPLGRVNGGMFDYMVKGPTMRELINAGYLCDYRLFAPTISIDREEIPVSESTGELNQNKMRQVAHKSRVVGDIVDSYMKIAPGKKGIVFVVDIEQAGETMRKFRDVGIKAEAVSGKTPDALRQQYIKQFERGAIDVLVNVDLFGEGFDVPACEVVSMGRPTESFGLYIQQFGRALRTSPGKTHGIIIDHVGNWQRHGLPDMKTNWSLERDLRGTPRGLRDPDVMPTRRCLNCFKVYEAITRTCPYCDTYDEPASRAGPEHVDGNLYEIDPMVLEAMRSNVDQILHGQALVPAHITDPVIIGAIQKNWRNRQAAVNELRDTINLWAGVEIKVNGRTEEAAHSVFYHKFGIDVLTAQGLKTSEMKKITEQIRKEWV